LAIVTNKRRDCLNTFIYHYIIAAHYKLGIINNGGCRGEEEGLTGILPS